MLGPPHRAQNAHLGAAATEVAVQFFANLLVGWMRMVPEQRRCGDDHAITAVATLGRLLFEKRLLDWVELLGGTQPLQGRDLRSTDLRDWQRAGADRLGSAQHQAGATLFQSTAE